MKRLRLPLVIVLLLLASHVNAQASLQRYFRVSDKATIELPPLMKDIEVADVIFIGEAHDDLKHHAVQNKIIRTLYADKVPVAVGLEMFASDSQQTLDDWVAGKLDEERFREVYSRNWSYDWRLYRDLFIFARDNHIPLVALNVPKPVVFKVVAQGSSALTEKERREIAPAISWTLNDPQTRYLGKTFAQVFGNRPGKISFTHFCEAQALRNNAMAWNIARYRKNHAVEHMVVLTGTWHAIRNGVPEQLAHYGNLSYRVILPELPEFSLDNATPGEADYVIVR